MHEFFKQQADWLKTWQDNQEKLTKQYSELGGDWMGTVLGGQNVVGSDFFENWFRGHDQLGEKFLEFSRSWQEMMSRYGGDKVPAEVLNLFNFCSFDEFYKNWLSSLDLSGGGKTPLNMTGGWQEASDFLRSFIEKDNPFFSVFSNTKMTEEMNRLLGMMQGVCAPSSGPYSDLLKGYQELVDSLTESTTAQSLEKLGEGFEAWKKEMEKYLLAPKVGINRELSQEISEGLVMSLDYIQAYGKMTRIVEGASRKAGSRFQSKLGEQTFNNDPVSKFTDFCALWTKENEAVFLEVFASEEYAKIQGEYTNAGHRLKIQLNKLAEKALEPTPVALKRDLDLAIAEIQQLKRDMRTLKRELKEQEKQARETRTMTEEAAKQAKAEAEQVAKQAKAEAEQVAKQAKAEAEQVAKQAKAAAEPKAEKKKNAKKSSSQAAKVTVAESATNTKPKNV